MLVLQKKKTLWRKKILIVVKKSNTNIYTNNTNNTVLLAFVRRNHTCGHVRQWPPLQRPHYAFVQSCSTCCVQRKRPSRQCRRLRLLLWRPHCRRLPLLRLRLLLRHPRCYRGSLKAVLLLPMKTGPWKNWCDSPLTTRSAGMRRRSQKKFGLLQKQKTVLFFATRVVER